jgi:hypothetical protein
MIYFDNQFATVRWDEPLGAVLFSWKQFADGDDFRSPISAGVDLLAKKKGRKWLGDLRNLGPVALDDQKWSAEVWFTRATALGMAYLALVSPRKVVAQMSVKTILNKVQGRDLVIAHFDELEDAARWLGAQR